MTSKSEQIRALNAAEKEKKRELLLRHFAATVREAMRVNDSGEFVHRTRGDVVRGLREKMAKGDPNLIAGYTNNTLGDFVLKASILIYRDRGVIAAGGKARDTYLAMPLPLFVADGDFAQVVPHEDWRRTFVKLRWNLPETTSVLDVQNVLFWYPETTRFSLVETRIAEARKLSGRD